MAELIAVTCPDRETATEVVRTLARLRSERLIELDDVVAVEKTEDAKVQLDQRADPTSLGALSGAFWGGLIGLLFWGSATFLRDW